MPAALGVELIAGHWLALTSSALFVEFLITAFLLFAAIFGALLATYTGVLLGVTAIPVWFNRRILLPIHFGTVGLGSAVSLLGLLGYHIKPLMVLGFLTAIVETLVWGWLEWGPRETEANALHQGRVGNILRLAEIATGPFCLIARCLGLAVVADLAFLVGGVVNRFGWIAGARSERNDTPLSTCTNC